MDRTSFASLTTLLAKSQLFALQEDDLPFARRLETTYLRAQAIARAYSAVYFSSFLQLATHLPHQPELTANDVTTLSAKFWAMHTDNIVGTDGAAMTVLTIQYNLAAGTIAPWAERRPELRPILQQILDFDAWWVQLNVLSNFNCILSVTVANSC
jgi:hypothetical protein